MKSSECLFRLREEKYGESAQNVIERGIRKVEVFSIHYLSLGIDYAALCNLAGNAFNHAFRDVNADNVPFWPDLLSRREQYRTPARCYI